MYSLHNHVIVAEHHPQYPWSSERSHGARHKSLRCGRGSRLIHYWLLPDTKYRTQPSATIYFLRAKRNKSSVSISSFTASDDVGVTGYLVTESPTAPLPGATGWLTPAPTSYTFTTAGSKTLYAWAKDAAGNVSASKSAAVTVDTPPTVTGFTLPPTANTLTVSISSFTASDDVGVTGYLVNESPTAPLPGANEGALHGPAMNGSATQGNG